MNQVIHVWPYENLQHRAEVRARAMQDPHWPPPVRDFILTMESEIYMPAPFSPPLGGGQKRGNIYEMRIYQYQPGSIPTVIERWAAALPERQQLSPLAACLWSEIGGLNHWMHIWPYADLAERARIRAQATQLPHWPPQTREFLVHMQNKILIPAAFSPMA